MGRSRSATGGSSILKNPTQDVEPLHKPKDERQRLHVHKVFRNKKGPNCSGRGGANSVRNGISTGSPAANRRGGGKGSTS